MPDAHQLIYLSVFNSGRVDSALECLRDILKVSRKNNARTGVTGCLIFDGYGFLQILEGENDAVDRTYEAIERDPRHRDSRIISRLTASERDFVKWSMADYLRRASEEAIFARHGVEGPVSRSLFSHGQALSLMKALAAARPETVAA